MNHDYGKWGKYYQCNKCGWCHRYFSNLEVCTKCGERHNLSDIIFDKYTVAARPIFNKVKWYLRWLPQGLYATGFDVKKGERNGTC